MKDAVMKEIHRIKDEIAKEHNFNLESLFRAARKRQALARGTVVKNKHRLGTA